MSNGHKEMAVSGNVRTDLAKEIVIIKNRLGFVPENSISVSGGIGRRAYGEVQVSIR